MLLEHLDTAATKHVLRDSAWEQPDAKPQLFQLLRQVFQIAQDATSALQDRCQALCDDESVRSRWSCIRPVALPCSRHNDLL